MRCKNCGFDTPNNSNYCSHCGSPVDFNDEFINIDNDFKEQPKEDFREEPINNRAYQQDMRTYQQNASIGWFFLGLVFPLLGFILYYVYAYSKPAIAIRIRKGAIVGLIIELIAMVIELLVYFL